MLDTVVTSMFSCLISNHRARVSHGVMMDTVVTSMFSRLISPDPTSRYRRVSAMSTAKQPIEEY